MNIELTRTQICDLMMATTLIKIEAIHELTDMTTKQDRKDILTKTVAKWENLHETLQSQLEQMGA